MAQRPSNTSVDPPGSWRMEYPDGSYSICQMDETVERKLELLRHWYEYRTYPLIREFKWMYELAEMNLITSGTVAK